ncbi:MAG: hypothetical protein MUE98_02375 [Rhodobacteraceae bacterium]|nr:hypothetical protein [Paracoccaceae bacterium]
MSDAKGKGGIDLGVYGRQDGAEGPGRAVVVAAAVTAAWLLLSGGFFLSVGMPAGLGPLGWVLVLVAVVFPVALVWVAALALRAAQAARADSARLQAAVDSLRHAYVTQGQSAGMAARPAENRFEAVAAAQGRAGVPVTSFVPARQPGDARRPTVSTRPPDVIAPAPSEAQASFALGTPAETPREPLTADEFIRALNFPDDEDDREGFRALRRALDDRDAARLVRASQDVLTLLSQDGIYMDDLKPDRARPEVWRRFAEGERGRPIAALGGIRDRSSLALAAARMRRDEIFRDAAHHFLRHFDRTFAAFAAGASDQEIADLAETRTARAFMLIGRVAGTFD